MSYASWWQGQYASSEADQSLTNLAATGADWIALIVTGYQETYTSTVIMRNLPKTPTNEDLVHVINYAHDLGLSVMLKPHVDLSADSEHWRGQIGAGFTEESQWQAWFASYSEFINHYAILAQENEVEQFCVGTELVATSNREENWREIVQGVRDRFKGPLTYASNHGGEESSITWWDAVDYIGVDAYYALTGKNDPSVDELKSAWTQRGYIGTLVSLSEEYDRPILLTEIGYRSVDGANIAPWEWQSEPEIDLQEQADAYQAALDVLWGQPWLAGIYWWNWLTDSNQGGNEDADFTPHDKPAETVLAEYYQGCDFIPCQALSPFGGDNSCSKEGASGEVCYCPSSTNTFSATVKIDGLEPNHAYAFSINCVPGKGSCNLLSEACTKSGEEGYCDVSLGVTDAQGKLTKTIEQPLPVGEYEVKFFVKDPTSNWCIPLQDDNPKPFTILEE